MMIAHLASDVAGVRGEGTSRQRRDHGTVKFTGQSEAMVSGDMLNKGGHLRPARPAWVLRFDTDYNMDSV